MRRPERRKRLQLTGAHFPRSPGRGKENKPEYESGERAVPRPWFRQPKWMDKPVDACGARSGTGVRLPPPPQTFEGLSGVGQPLVN